MGSTRAYSHTTSFSSSLWKNRGGKSTERAETKSEKKERKKDDAGLHGGERFVTQYVPDFLAPVLGQHLWTRPEFLRF
jgi:hypothetical protein